MNGARVNAVVQELRGVRRSISSTGMRTLPLLIENSIAMVRQRLSLVMGDPEEKVANVISARLPALVSGN